jgi:hypothetical protein
MRKPGIQAEWGFWVLVSMNSVPAVRAPGSHQGRIHQNPKRPLCQSIDSANGYHSRISLTVRVMKIGPGIFFDEILNGLRRSIRQLHRKVQLSEQKNLVAGVPLQPPIENLCCRPEFLYHPDIQLSTGDENPSGVRSSEIV